MPAKLLNGNTLLNDVGIDHPDNNDNASTHEEFDMYKILAIISMFFSIIMVTSQATAATVGRGGCCPGPICLPGSIPCHLGAKQNPGGVIQGSPNTGRPATYVPHAGGVTAPPKHRQQAAVAHPTCSVSGVFQSAGSGVFAGDVMLQVRQQLYTGTLHVGARGEKSCTITPLRGRVGSVKVHVECKIKKEPKYLSAYIKWNTAPGGINCSGKILLPAIKPLRHPLPKITYFWIEPKVQKPGGTIKFHWAVENTEHVRLFDDRGEIDLRSPGRPGRGENGWFSTTIDRVTTFRLQAENRARNVTSKSFTVRISRKVALKGRCGISGKLAGRWQQQIRERLNGPTSRRTVGIFIYKANSRRPFARATVKNNGTYYFKGLEANKKYKIRPDWRSRPVQAVASCRAGRTNNGPHFRIAGSPRID